MCKWATEKQPTPLGLEFFFLFQAVLERNRAAESCTLSETDQGIMAESAFKEIGQVEFTDAELDEL